MKHLHHIRILALVLAFVCVSSMLVGCHGNAGDVADTAGQTEAETTPAVTDEVTTDAETTSAVTDEVTTEAAEETPVLTEQMYYFSEISDRVKHHGRTKTVSDGIQCDFTASGISFEAYVEGHLTFDVVTYASAQAYFTVWVDGERLSERFLVWGQATIDIGDLGDMALHEIKILKQTEASNSVSLLKSVSFCGELVGAAQEQEYYIEFIGDSITSGYGNLCALGTENSGLAQHQDGTQTYAFLACETLGADMSAVSCSGIGIHRGWTNQNGQGYNMDVFYAKDSHFRYENTPYDFSSARVPDLVVINLGTNDASMQGRDSGFTIDGYKAGVAALIKQVRNAYGKDDLPIIWVYGMMGQGCAPYTKEVISDLGGEGAGLYMVMLTPNNEGGEGHPSIKGHTSAANLLVKFIEDKGLLGH